jgi:hypothetical protein
LCRPASNSILIPEALCSVTDIYGVACSIQDDNKSRIADIQARRVVVTRTLQVVPRIPNAAALSFVVQEIITEQPASEFLSSWRCDAVFEAVEDKFKDKLDFNIRTFLQVIHMNVVMLTAMKNNMDILSMFGADVPLLGKELLLRFVRNYSNLNREIQGLQTRMDGPNSQLAEATRAVDDISERMRSVMAQFHMTAEFPPAAVVSPAPTAPPATTTAPDRLVMRRLQNLFADAPEEDFDEDLFGSKQSTSTRVPVRHR